MISGKKYPIEKYDPKNLFQFIKCGFSLKMEYFNSMINQWESFIEPYSLNFNLKGTLPFSENLSFIIFLNNDVLPTDEFPKIITL